MATHSSILAWRIPWTEEPGRLQGQKDSDILLPYIFKEQVQTIAIVF